MLNARQAGSRSVYAVTFTDAQLAEIDDAETEEDTPVFQTVYKSLPADKPRTAAQYAAWYCRHQYAERYNVDVETIGSKTRKNGDGYSFVIFAK